MVEIESEVHIYKNGCGVSKVRKKVGKVTLIVPVVLCGCGFFMVVRTEREEYKGPK